MLELHNILEKGYFPRELPPPFNTSDFSHFIKNCDNDMLKSFNSNHYQTKCATHNLPRSGMLRRSLGIPNPINFYQLARFIKKNWTEICNHTGKSKISLTTPTKGTKERAIDRKHTLQELPKWRAMLRGHSRYVLKADINQFYHSIYTHSIPWALHGKTKAKADQSPNLIGNKLDKLVRKGQDRQTIGIPIGPDTSLVIAEIILSTVDQTLEKAKITKGIRYIDDYDFGFQTLAKAEEALCKLQEILNDYELALNPNKTECITLPYPTDQLKISELRTFQFRESPTAQYFDILYYFDKAFSFANTNPKEAILRYAVSRLSGITIHKANWNFCENLFLQCAISEPGTIPFVLNQLLQYQNQDYDLHKDHISDVLNSIIEQHALYGHGSDVAWALWGLLVLRRKLRKEAANRAAKMKDPIVAILLCDAYDHELVSSNTNWDYLASFTKSEDLKGDMWLFSYEALRRKWFEQNIEEQVMPNSPFSKLNKAKVSFYDHTLSNTVIPEESVKSILVSSLGLASD